MMSRVRLPERYDIEVWRTSDEAITLGPVLDSDGAAVDCSEAESRALVKRHLDDDDDEAAAELAVTWGGTGNSVPTVALADDAGLDAGTYHWSLLVTFEEGHDLAGETRTVAHGTLIVQEQATRAQAAE